MVKTMAVTKNRSLKEILKVLNDKEITIIGENRVEEAQKKLPHLTGVEKHLIGHLQSRKTRDAVNLFGVIETVDSEKIARKINSECKKIDKTMQVMIQINISREPQKSGVLEENLEELVSTIKQLPYLKLIGLMTIAENTSDEAKLRAQFSGMRELKEKYNFPELSMGMSQDHKIAIEEGATIIRLGRALFE